MNLVDNGDDNERTIWFLEKSEFMIVFYTKGAGKNKKKLKRESKEVCKYQMQAVNKVVCSGVVHLII